MRSSTSLHRFKNSPSVSFPFAVFADRHTHRRLLTAVGPPSTRGTMWSIWTSRPIKGRRLRPVIAHLPLWRFHIDHSSIAEISVPYLLRISLALVRKNTFRARSFFLSQSVPRFAEWYALSLVRFASICSVVIRCHRCFSRSRFLSARPGLLLSTTSMALAASGFCFRHSRLRWQTSSRCFA